MDPKKIIPLGVDEPTKNFQSWFTKEYCIDTESDSGKISEKNYKFVGYCFRKKNVSVKYTVAGKLAAKILALNWRT